MRKLLLLTPVLLFSCAGLRYSSSIHKFDGEHISEAIYELGPNYILKEDPIVGKVYSWRSSKFVAAEADTNGNIEPAYIDAQFIHLYTTPNDTVTRGIYSTR